MKAKKVLLTIFTTCILAAGVVLSPFAAGTIAFAETKDTSAQATEQTQASEKETEQEKEQEVALTPEQQAEKDRKEAQEALQKDPNHVHKFRWIAKMNQSESAEGTMNYMCSECGKIWYYKPIPAYLAFSGETAYKIETAPQGALVKVKTSLFISFNNEVMEALAQRPDVSLYVSFLDQEYKGNRVSFTIPAGQDTMSLVDSNGYVGFLFLGGTYGLKMEVPMEDPLDHEPSGIEVTEGEAVEASEASTENAAEVVADKTNNQ